MAEDFMRRPLHGGIGGPHHVVGVDHDVEAMGGEVVFGRLIVTRRHADQRQMRETGAEMEEDDVRGEPQGHFVALVGYDSRKREVIVADPLDVHPPFYTAKYRLAMDRLINAILLGILTNDANLLVITPKGARTAAEDDMATTVPVPRRKRLPSNRNKTRPGR